MSTQEQTRARLWTVKEVADFLGVPKSWVYSHVADKSLPHHKVGRYVRFNPSEIKGWLAVGHRG